MDYLVTFDDGSSAYLEHHGTKGMKWGVWNEETRSKYQGGDSSYKGAKKTIRALNALDKRRAVEFGKGYDARKTSDRYAKKAAKATFKGNALKAGKMQLKAEKYADVADKHEKAVGGIEKHQRKLVAKINKDGYNVKTRYVRRSVYTNGQKAVMLVVGAAGGVYIDRTVGGTKYKLGKYND